MNDSSRRASARVRRARRWLNAVIVAHVLTLVAINVLVGIGYVQPAVAAVVVMVFATGPLLLLLRNERRHPSDDRPSCWPARALATSLPQAVASELVGASLLGEWRLGHAVGLRHAVGSDRTRGAGQSHLATSTDT